MFSSAYLKTPVVEALNKLIGTKVGPIASCKERPPQPDIVSGATVTVLVMADSIVQFHSLRATIRSGRIFLQQHARQLLGDASRRK